MTKPELFTVRVNADGSFDVLMNGRWARTEPGLLAFSLGLEAKARRTARTPGAQCAGVRVTRCPPPPRRGAKPDEATQVAEILALFEE